MKNKTDQVIHIPKRLRLGMLCEVDYENVFFADVSDEALPKATTPKPLPEASTKPSTKGSSKPKKPTTTNWIKKAATLAAVATMSIAGSLSQLTHNATATTDLAKETKLPNSIMVYGNRHNTQLLSNLVDEFPSVWKDKGFVNVPKDRWIKITLRNDWQNRLPTTNKSLKVYLLGI